MVYRAKRVYQVSIDVRVLVVFSKTIIVVQLEIHYVKKESKIDKGCTNSGGTDTTTACNKHALSAFGVGRKFRLIIVCRRLLIMIDY